MFLVLLAVASVATQPVRVLKAHKQHAFPKTVPAGNYSGLSWVADNRYVVVSDKAKNDGFFWFTIDVDTVSGDIVSVKTHDYKTPGAPNRDMEGIVYVPQSQTVFVSGEKSNRVLEYTLDGAYTGRELSIPSCYHRATYNYGLEGLAYSAETRRFWVCNESTLKGDGEQANSVNGVQNRIRLQSFSDVLEPLEQYAYLMDKPKAHKPTALYGMGVSEITALENGDVLVLEREFYTPPSKIGAFVVNKLYQVSPSGATTNRTDTLSNATLYLPKHLVYQWKTKLNLTKRTIANYEGMCLGPKLSGNRRVLILLSDSQDQAGGVLKDYFRSIVVQY